MADHTNSLGEFLRQERERRGITIEQVASATKISVRLLHSIEGDHFADLPAKPFIRGFVTAYARFIGLDPKEILTRFGRFIDEKALDRPSKEGGHSGYVFEKREGDQSRRTLWTVMGVFMVMGVVGAIFKPSLRGHKNRHEKLQGSMPESSPSPMGSASPLASASPTVSPSPAPSPSPSMSPAASPSAAPKPSPKPKPSPSAVAKPATPPAAAPAAPAAPVAPVAPAVPVTSPTPASSASPLPSPSVSPSSKPEKPDPLNSGVNIPNKSIKQKLIVKALADIWVRYRCDDRPKMKFMLRKDRLLVLRAEKSIVVQFSNPDAAQLTSNTRGTKLASADTTLKNVQDTATLGYPSEALDSIGEIFSAEKPLPKTPAAPETP